MVRKKIRNLKIKTFQTVDTKSIRQKKKKRE
jgi:hypothetical protein